MPKVARLAIVCTHPVQYYAPVFQLLANDERVDLKVFYTWGESAVEKYDPGFRQVIKWDISLLDSYEHTFLSNVSMQPGSHHFSGIVNPGAIAAIEDFNPHALLVYGWAYNSHLKVLRHFKGKVPVWFRGDSTLLDKRGSVIELFRRCFLKWVYSYVDKAFYAGALNRDYFVEYGLEAGQLIFAPHAVDNERFGASREAEAKALRNSLGALPADKLVLFTGKFEPKKNPLALAEAFSGLSGKRAHLLMAGAGEQEQELRNYCGKLDGVTVHSFVNQRDIAVYYQACNLFCLPSKGPGESWGLAVNEAMAAGKAVLVSDRAGCVPDLVQTGVNGNVFDPFEPGALERNLNAMLTEESRLNEMGEASRKIISNYSFIKQVEAIVEQLMAVL